MTAEQVLRVAILKQLKQWAYRVLWDVIDDSDRLRSFCRFGDRAILKFNTFAENVKRIRVETWKAVNAVLLQEAKVDNTMAVPGFLGLDYECGSVYECFLTPDVDDLDGDGDAEELIVLSNAMQVHMTNGGPMGHMHGMGFGIMGPHTAPVPVPSAKATNGERIFQTGCNSGGRRIASEGGPPWLHMHGGGCAACHGVDGRGGQLAHASMGTLGPGHGRPDRLSENARRRGSVSRFARVRSFFPFGCAGTSPRSVPLKATPSRSSG